MRGCACCNQAKLVKVHHTEMYNHKAVKDYYLSKSKKCIVCMKFIGAFYKGDACLSAVSFLREVCTHLHALALETLCERLFFKYLFFFPRCFLKCNITLVEQSNTRETCVRVHGKRTTIIEAMCKPTRKSIGPYYQALMPVT